MKKFLLFAAAIMLFACNPQQTKKYTVTVNVNTEVAGLEQDPRIVLHTADNSITDTVNVVNGVAVFTGSIDGLAYAYINSAYEDAEGENITFCRFILENDIYSVNIDATEEEGSKPFKVQIVTQNNTQAVADSLEQVSKSLTEELGFNDLYKEYVAAYQEQKKEKMDSLRTTLFKIQDKIAEIEEHYLAENPTSLYALLNASANINYISLDSAKKVLERFALVEAYKSNNVFKKIKQMVAQKGSLAPGNQAPDFTLNDTEGNPVTFSKIYTANKYTMIDFWASWCGPCRGFNPTLVKLYAEYAPKGFGIIGVSLDSKKESWLKAIEEDQLTWTHVSDLNGWENEVAQLYMIKSIPQSYLVDHSGKIVLQSPEEEELIEFLKTNLQ